jgi:hypothetical protein
MNRSRNAIAAKLLDAAITDGGITLSAIDFEYEPIAGYVVGGVSAPCTIDEYTWKYFRSQAIHSIVDWLVTRPDHYGVVIPTGYVGSWRNERGQIVIDQVTITFDLDDAMEMARERDEDAIYSLQNGREIPV